MNNDLYGFENKAFKVNIFDIDERDTNNNETIRLFNILDNLQYLNGYDDMKKQLVTDLEKQFEQAVLNENEKYLYDLRYRCDGLIIHKMTGHRIIASPWTYVKTETNDETLISQKKKELIARNLEYVSREFRDDTASYRDTLFMKQIQIHLGLEPNKPNCIDYFIKRLKIVDAILALPPESRYIFENKKGQIAELASSLKHILRFIGKRHKAHEERRGYRFGHLDAKSVETIANIITDSNSIISYENKHKIRDILTENVKPCKNISNIKTYSSWTYSDFMHSINLTEIETWDMLKQIKKTYEAMYANEDMRPVYEKLGLIIKNYHPLQSI